MSAKVTHEYITSGGPVWYSAGGPARKMIVTETTVVSTLSVDHNDNLETKQVISYRGILWEDVHIYMDYQARRLTTYRPRLVTMFIDYMTIAQDEQKPTP